MSASQGQPPGGVHGDGPTEAELDKAEWDAFIANEGPKLDADLIETAERNAPLVAAHLAGEHSRVPYIRCPMCKDRRCCDQDFGGSHYHCGRCNDPKPTSMQGHYLRFDDGTWGFHCDPAHLGKSYFDGTRSVTDDDVRPAHSDIEPPLLAGDSRPPASDDPAGSPDA